jgi:hypothetical protein
MNSKLEVVCEFRYTANNIDTHEMCMNLEYDLHITLPAKQ